MNVLMTNPAIIELAYSGFVQSFGHNLTAGTLGAVLFVCLSVVNIAVYYIDKLLRNFHSK